MENSRFRKIIVIINYLCVAKQARIWIIQCNWVMLYGESWRLSRFWTLRRRCQSCTRGKASGTKNIGRNGWDWMAVKLNIVIYIERLFAPHRGWIGALFLCPKPWANTRDWRCFIWESLFMSQTSREIAITATTGQMAERVVVWVEIIATTCCTKIHWHLRTPML